MKREDAIPGRIVRYADEFLLATSGLSPERATRYIILPPCLPKQTKKGKPCRRCAGGCVSLVGGHHVHPDNLTLISGVAATPAKPPKPKVPFPRGTRVRLMLDGGPRQGVVTVVNGATGQRCVDLGDRFEGTNRHRWCNLNELTEVPCQPTSPSAPRTSSPPRAKASTVTPVQLLTDVPQLPTKSGRKSRMTSRA